VIVVGLFSCIVFNAETNGTRGARAEDNSNGASQSTSVSSSSSAGKEGGGGELRD
jgi:hypothetical protein